MYGFQRAYSNKGGRPDALARAEPALHICKPNLVCQPIGTEVFGEGLLLVVDRQGRLWPGVYWPAPFYQTDKFDQTD